MTIDLERMRYRVATPDDQALIDDMNVVASYRGREPDAELPETRLFMDAFPDAKAYSENFGRLGDLGLIAEDADGEMVGAIWGREYARTEEAETLESHPFEITMAVRDSVRGQGIGQQLLDSFAIMAWLQGKDEVSLGVHEENPGARRLYEFKGYIPIVDDNGVEARLKGGYTPMVRILKPER